MFGLKMFSELGFFCHWRICLLLIKLGFETWELYIYARNFWWNTVPMAIPPHRSNLLLLLLSRFSRVRLCATPETAAHQVPPSLDSPARTLEWVAISFSNACKWKVKVKSLSRVWLFATPWTAAHQAPPSMGFSRQEYWSGVPLPSPSFTSSMK